MADRKHYVIRGGLEGRERLKILSRVMHATTAALFERIGVSSGMTCLDVGCGSGDVAMELCRRVGPQGRVMGADIDETKVELARQEAESLGIRNVEFRTLDIRGNPSTLEFDVVYARFVLTHLQDPVATIDTFYQHLKPGGFVILEDIDFSGYFVYPESKVFNRYHELYCAAVRRRGGDPNIGPRLPLMLKQRGFAAVEMAVVQPVGFAGEVKLINPLTMENIADVVLQENLATREEISDLVQGLYDWAADPETVAGVPRVVQTWGRRPAA